MANTYTWSIKQLDTIPDFNGFVNFVTRVFWVYTGVDEIGTTSKVEGYTEYNQRSTDPYIEYSALTESEVTTWLEETRGSSDLKIIIDNKINEILNPPIIVLPLPWVPEPIQEVVPDIPLETPSEPTQDPVV